MTHSSSNSRWSIKKNSRRVGGEENQETRDTAFQRDKELILLAVSQNSLACLSDESTLKMKMLKWIEVEI
jgi:hypothetical protein